MTSSQEPETREHKTDFTGIYTAPDPRPYYTTLTPLEYQVPDNALPLIESAIDAPGRTSRARTVLDLCCSYGINSALLRHGVGVADLGARYAEPALDGVAGAALADADAAWFASRRRRSDLTIFGQDIAAPAVDYAKRAGLLDGGWADNLEIDDPSPEFEGAMSDVGTVVCTGGVGYIGEPTLGRVLAATGTTDVWFVMFVLRVWSYDAISAFFDGHGFATEKMPGTFRQRRFASGSEQEAAIHDVEARGLDPAGKEADGWFHAECFVTRPA